MDNTNYTPAPKYERHLIGSTSDAGQQQPQNGMFYAPNLLLHVPGHRSKLLITNGSLEKRLK